LKSATSIFTLLIGVIGLISLVITFFLLLIATTQNIKENVWEYGVLRSVGLNMNEGHRIFMYEAFLVILSAGVLGVFIGVLVASLVTN
jgi:ABC-type antimicrobial peptide transport system permease subunit